MEFCHCSSNTIGFSFVVKVGGGWGGGEEREKGEKRRGKKERKTAKPLMSVQ